MTGFFKTFSAESTGLKKAREDWSGLERKLLVANAISLLVLFIVVASGCSPSQQIAATTTTINRAATSSKERFAIIHAETEEPTPDLGLIAEQAVGGQEEQEEILLLTGHIHEMLPGVEDKVPEWVYLLEYIAIGLSILAVAWILWNTGIGTLIKRLIGFVPSPKRRDAVMARSMLDPLSPVTVREYVAARRAEDPEFNRAYERTRPRPNSPVRQDAGPHARV